MRWVYVWAWTAALLPVAVLATVVLAKRRRSWRPAVAEVGMVYGTVPWVWMILTPVTVPPGTEMTHWVPGEDVWGLMGTDQFWVQIGGNLGVFFALGAFGPIRTTRFQGVWRLLAVGAGGSLILEVLQRLLIGGRVFSVDDVLLNALGCLIGGLITRRWWRPSRSSGPGP